MESTNKENIPPFSSDKSNEMVNNNPSKKRGFKRRNRQPLEDITYFYQSSIQLILSQDFDSSPSSSSSSSSPVDVVVSVSSNSKKRKPVSHDLPNAKSLRFGFR
ncbi:hypothetical protein M5689_012468 [Euphorbia peplus]|nr:hypothetical protein M5689_012468 [Euphorbia peplus]